MRTRSVTAWLYVIALLFAAPPAAGQAGSAAWTTVLGVAAGYSNTHAVGVPFDHQSLALPSFGAGQTFLGTGIPIATPPSLFVVLPLGGRLALELGWDVQRAQRSGVTSFSGQLAPRLDFAVSGGWYGGAGPVLHYIDGTSFKAFATVGLGVAWGRRFHVTGDLGGRLEANYTMFAVNHIYGGATNTFGLMLGATMPL